MKLEVLGTGCSRCKKLMELTEQAVRELRLAAEIVKVDRLEDIMKYDVMSTPALVIDGVLKFAGRVPSLDELKKIIGENK